jgi:hypothetical protein
MTAWENRHEDNRDGRDEGEGLRIFQYLRALPHEALPFK